MANVDELGRWLNGVVFWREHRCAAALTINPEDATRRDESRKSKHVMMYVCMVMTFIIIRGRQINLEIHVLLGST